MNIDGTNTLACTQAIDDIKGEVRITPLPHMEVVKDLVPDFKHFYAQYASIKPWLQTVTPTPSGAERLQSVEQRAKIDGLVRMHPVCLLLDGVPVVTGGTATSSWGRRSCSRPIAGSPTAATR